MAIGLKRGTVALHEHNPEWKIIAAETIRRLWGILGDAAVDIQHVGSTAIPAIKAKPIIDIAVAVREFDGIEALMPMLLGNGWSKSALHAVAGDMLIVDGDEMADTRTHHIHIVIYGSAQWKNYICFRDFLNADINAANAYDAIKQQLALKYSSDKNAYTAGKEEIVESILQKAGIWNEFGRRFTKIEPIDKGWSADRKYRVETTDARRMLLRVSDIDEYHRKKAEYGMMERVYALGVPTPEPIEFGLCDGGKSCYSLSGWLDGEDAASALVRMSEAEQYALGLNAGALLRKIHTLPAPEDAEPWADWFYRKVYSRIDFYKSNPVNSENGDLLIGYLVDNKHLLYGRPQTFCHGDFNVSNIMIMPGNAIGVLDFNAFNKDYGDPWWEFDPCMDGWGSEPSPHFHSGLIKGYFNGEPPREFFEVFSYYLAYDALAALCDTCVHNQGEPEVGRRHMENVLRWLDNMNNPVPAWYLPDFYIQYTDGVPYKLKSPFDFSFLGKYGRVFKVYDDQDSGNICFGIRAEDGKRYFIKFAGAPTQRAFVSAKEAVDNLKHSMPIYKDLAHPNLIKLVDAGEICGAGSPCGGFAAVFEWADVECMGRMYPLSRQKFMAMPLEVKMQVFSDVLAFHAHVTGCGYVAIDFYDGSILYDFENGKTLICDIDLYAKAPYTNNIGRLWGSSRFMSPEEFQLGAAIDEITNVYAMGATAFAIFSDYERTLSNWPLSKGRYAVAKKAVNYERSERQQSIRQFIREWEAAK